MALSTTDSTMTIAIKMRKMTTGWGTMFPTSSTMSRNLCIVVFGAAAAFMAAASESVEARSGRSSQDPANSEDAVGAARRCTMDRDSELPSEEPFDVSQDGKSPELRRSSIHCNAHSRWLSLLSQRTTPSSLWPAESGCLVLAPQPLTSL